MTKTWAIRASLMIILGISFLLPDTASATTVKEYFVALNGHDANPGTKAKPFLTIEAARDAVRSLKEKERGPLGSVTIWIRGGAYSRSKPFELTAADSGTKEFPIVYRAYQDEEVRLLGSQLLKGFKPTADPAILDRLNKEARTHILEADLPSQGIMDFGGLRSRGFGRPISPSHLELFFGEQPMTLARWPNDGEWEKIAGFPKDSAQDDGHGGKIGGLEAGFFYAGDRPRNWKNLEDVWVHGFWAWDWANSYEKIESLDLEKRWIKTVPPHGHYGFRADQRFYFLNILEELDRPGEWYLDRKTGKLYFWPPKAAESAEVMVSILEKPMIALQEASYITIRGLDFGATRGHAISISGGAGNLIAGCRMRLIGNYGVWVDRGKRHGVLSCDIENTGDGGVWLIGGDRQTLEPGGHFVENCHFQKQGRWSLCYVPSIIISGVGQRAAHNLIHDHPHCPILYSGNDHRIEWNEIHHVALETGDVGAIYAGRDWTFRGNIIQYNFIHHTGGVGMGSMGVYMDDCVSGAEIVGNIFYQVKRAVFLGGGRDHRVENNIFVECHPAVEIDGRGLDKSPVWSNMVYQFMKQQLLAVPQQLYRSRYPAIGDLDRYYQTAGGVPPENNRVARNICSGGEWLKVGWHADPSLIRVHDNFVDKEPGFVSLAKMDFRLKKGAPALAAGFVPIPVEKIGLYRDEYRRR
jgi:hypothetical protein